LGENGTNNDLFSYEGIGNPDMGPLRIYRRNVPTVNGSTAIIHVSNSPTTLKVTAAYADPYSYLNYEYEINVTQTTQPIPLYIEPSFSNDENTITLTDEGNPQAQPVVINSSQYWDTIGKTPNLTDIYLNQGSSNPTQSWLETTIKQLFGNVLLVILLVVIAVVAVGSVLLVRRRRSRFKRLQPFPPPPPPPPPPP
jgi:hypothetical protein